MLSSIGITSCEYNHQGVRFIKRIGTQTIHYFNDGSRILGEDRTVNGHLRYFYDVNGVIGVRHNNQNYKLVRDAYGNVAKMYHISHSSNLNGDRVEENLVAEYDYDSYGNHTIRAYDDNGNLIANPLPTHISRENPWRWKGHYYDHDTGFYYINGRYYDPTLGHYLDADDVESLLPSAFTLFALDRNAVTVDNILSALPNFASIFTAMELFPDPHDSAGDKSWFQANWQRAVRWLLIILVFLVATILKFTPGTQLIGIALHKAAIKGAVSGLIIGGAIGGLIAHVRGDCFQDGVRRGMISGAMNGFIGGAVMGAAKLAVKGIVNAANTAKHKPVVEVPNSVQPAPQAVQPPIINKFSDDFLNWLNTGEANNAVYKGISQSGSEVYTGITKQKLNVRLSQHNNPKSKYFKDFSGLEVVVKNFTRNQARALETFKILTDGTSILNKSLSISKNHRFFKEAMQWASVFGG